MRRTDTEAKKEKEGYGMRAQSPTQLSRARLLLGLIIHHNGGGDKRVSRKQRGFSVRRPWIGEVVLEAPTW